MVEDIQDLLSKGKSTAGATPYKDVKTRIVEIYGQRPEDVYKVAKDLMLTGKPSQLARKLIQVVCPKHADMVGCCSEAMISGMWREKLPPLVRAGVADMSLGGGNLNSTLNTADSIYASSGEQAVVAIQLTAAAAAAAGGTSDEVAAYKRQQQQKNGGGSQQKKQLSGAEGR